MRDSPEGAARLTKSSDRMAEIILKRLERDDKEKKRKGDNEGDDKPDPAKKMKAAIQEDHDKKFEIF